MEENDGIIFFSQGIDGSAVFSVFTEEERIPIPTLAKKDLKEISSEFVRLYPDEADQICKFYNQVFCGSFPKNVNISHLEPSQKEDFMKEIAKNFRK